MPKVLFLNDASSVPDPIRGEECATADGCGSGQCTAKGACIDCEKCTIDSPGGDVVPSCQPPKGGIGPIPG